MKKSFTHTSIIKTASSVLAIALMLSFSGCGSSDKKTTQDETKKNAAAVESNDTDGTTTFTKEGLSITLPDSFSETEQKPYTFYYLSSNALCTGNKESKTDVTNVSAAVTNLDDYAALVLEKTGVTAEITAHSDTSRTFSWEKEINNTEYSYIGFVTETGDSYWLIQFACPKTLFEDYRDDFNKYFDSITTTPI